MTQPYRHPYDNLDGAYSEEPTDAEAIVLARALAHWCATYPERTAEAIVLDILESNGASAEQMTRDECLRIARAVGVSI